MLETKFLCAVSGVPLSRTGAFAGAPDPWAPSIDRIENRHGYLKDNVRVVSLVANLAMNRWGYDVMLRLAKAVVRNAGQPTPEASEEKMAYSCHTADAHTTQEIDNATELAFSLDPR